ncbi:MAG: hypothetical protein HY796_04460 [Elusimicrobia bacterium]|nr:hypothetical protein [Elusimicrobiota bacterium]
MKRIIMSAVLLLAVNSAYAAESKGGALGYFQNLLKGLKTKIQGKLESKNRVSAVAAVRGKSQSSDPHAVYWKGGVSDKAEKKLAAEKQKLAGAAQLVVNGETAEGKAALEKFLRENSDSVYAADAKEALANLPKEEAPAAATEEKSDDKVKPEVPEKPAPVEDDNE